MTTWSVDLAQWRVPEAVHIGEKSVSQLFKEDNSSDIACFDQWLAESYFTKKYDSSSNLYTKSSWLPQSSPATTSFNEDQITQAKV